MFVNFIVFLLTILILIMPEDAVEEAKEQEDDPYDNWETASTDTEYYLTEEEF